MTFYYDCLLERKGTHYNVSFPDFTELESLHLYGKNIEEVYSIAKDAMESYFLSSGDVRRHTLLSEGNVEVQLISTNADTDFYRMREENQSVNHMVTLPKYLVDLAENTNVDFSHIVVEALRKKLGI